MARREKEQVFHSKHLHSPRPKSTVTLNLPTSGWLEGWFQRASVVIRLAHISKKSMVCDPWRGVSRGELPDRDPGREELSWGRSIAGLAESILSLGLWRPAVEPDLWGVDDPDLKPTASIMSSRDRSTIASQFSRVKQAVLESYTNLAKKKPQKTKSNVKWIEYASFKESEWISLPTQTEPWPALSVLLATNLQTND